MDRFTAYPWKSPLWKGERKPVYDTVSSVKWKGTEEGSEAMVAEGVYTGIMPVKGLPLPFISYGGSFLFSSFMMIGLILNFGRTEID